MGWNIFWIFLVCGFIATEHCNQFSNNFASPPYAPSCVKATIKPETASGNKLFQEAVTRNFYNRAT